MHYLKHFPHTILFNLHNNPVREVLSFSYSYQKGNWGTRRLFVQSYTQEISGRSGSPSTGFKVMATLPLRLILQTDDVFMENNQIVIK